MELVTEDNVRLSAWYTPPQNGALILVAHGYGDKRTEHYYTLFASHGYGVIAWDFRAHGTSEGNFSSLGYYEVLDARAALDFALAQPGVAVENNPHHIAFKQALKEEATRLGLEFDDYGSVARVSLGSGAERVGVITHGDVQPVDPSKWRKSQFELDRTKEFLNSTKLSVTP